MSATARTLTILRRFPRHLEVDDPGKLFSDVVDGLGHELDVKSVQLGRVRRSHALGDADEERDVLLLGGLHDLKAEDLELTGLRLDALRAVGATLADASSSPGDKQAAVERLQQLLRLQPDAFPAWPAEGADTAPAEARLAAALRELAAYPSELDLLRGTIESVVRLHRAGNGTVAALLGAGATYLELGLDSIVDTDDLYWHVATCHDLLRLEPMVVNLDAGFGVVFTGSVPDGQELRFESDGRVTLAGSSVARLSYTFTGGVFGDTGQKFAGDFVFAGDSVSDKAATFAVTQPIPDGFEPGAIFPHSDGLLESASLVVGESRWAFFVRAANYGGAAATPTGEFAVPIFDAGVFDTSVFEPDTSVGSPSSGRIGFSWQEHEPFAARLWIPLRFSSLDVSGEIPVNERLRLLLDRHRAAGIHIYVEYADDRWTAPAGILRDAGSNEPLGTVIVGTALWAAQTVTPT